MYTFWRENSHQFVQCDAIVQKRAQEERRCDLWNRGHCVPSCENIYIYERVGVFGKKAKHIGVKNDKVGGCLLLFLRVQN